MQQEQEKAIAMLLLCKATIQGDCQAIRALLSEPADTENVPWYMPEVHKLLSRGTIKMHCPIAVSIMEKKYDATKELLLRTDLDMRRKTVDWGRLKLTLLHPSWIYSISPWVVNLKLGNNHLHMLPSEFQQSTQLRRLDLSHNLIKTVPVHIFSLPNLEFLNLSHNKLVEIPEAKWTQSLISLDLSQNQLTSLPTSIQDSSLEILNLSKNKFTTIPKSLCRIKTLTTLDLRSMPITSLPQEMAMLDRLVNLNIVGCNINDIPPNFNHRAGVRGLFRARTRSRKACNHIKLVVLCGSNTAKSVTYSRLRPNIAPPTSHLSDMEQFQWSHKQLRLKLFTNQKLIFNTWMVGLSREYRSIYSCLYTANALYVLVLDLTKSTDLSYHFRPYINGICRQVAKANVLVIAVLPDPLESWPEANSTSLNRKISAVFAEPLYRTLVYHGLVLTSVSSANKDTPVDIRAKIYEVAAAMNVGGNLIINQQVPENYFQLLPELGAEHDSCKVGGKPGILEEGSLWQLLDHSLGSGVLDTAELPIITSFLKETGYLLHFEDPNQRLDQCYFIHPEWIVATFHKMLQQLHRHYSTKPVVSKSKLVSLIKPCTHVDAVIRMMVRFAIVLPISDVEFLVPSLLPVNAPPLAIRQSGCFRRQLMPKILPIPDEFWYYLITHLLHRLPRLLVENSQPAGASSVVSSESNSPSTEKTNAAAPMVPVQQLEDSLELTTGGLPAIQRPRSLYKKKDELKAALDVVPRSRVRTPDQASRGLETVKDTAGSPTGRSPLSDPVELEQGLLVWQTGVLLQRGNLQFGVYSQTSELSMDEKGIEICASDGESGCQMMARVCWAVEKLLEQRFPYLFTLDVQPVNQGLTQIILCPRCVQERKHANTSVTNFVIETCFVSIKDEELPTHNCHHHSDPIPLRYLIPEYLMVDLPSEMHLLRSKFQISEVPPVHRESATSLHEGMFQQQPVLIKMLTMTDSRPLTVPLSCLRQEMTMLTTLKHPNIIQTFGFSLHPQCIILERAPMGTLLQKLMDNEQKISRLARFSIAHQVASALEYLHRNGIIYRTLKADSILTWSLEFEDDVSVKLANFDRAEYISPSGLLGRAEFSSYPSPEMARYSFKEEYTEKVDIYSFAILLYELIARWQPFASERVTISHRPKLTGLVTYGFQVLLQLMKKCWGEDPDKRPSSRKLVQLISTPSFQCHFSSQALRDCVSVRGCCSVSSLRQIWVYGEYVTRRCNISDNDAEVEGTQVFIVNADDLTVQGSLELKERTNAICTVDSKVWVGMLEASIHVYDSTTFLFTDRIHLKDSVTAITTNDTNTFVGLANGTITYYVKLNFPKECYDLKIGTKAIICMVPVEASLWVSCGHEIVVLSAEEEVEIVKRLDVCDTKDQVSALVLCEDRSVMWSAVRGSLTLTCWSICTYEKVTSINLSTQLNVVCCDLNLDPSHLRLHSFISTQDTLWIALQNGVIVILSNSEAPEVISWFRAHCSATRCLLEIPCHENSTQSEAPVVLSGGFGEHPTLCSLCPPDGGVIMSWQSLTCDQFRILNRRRETVRK